MNFFNRRRSCVSKLDLCIPYLLYTYIMKSLLAAVVLFNFVSFWWSVIGVFKKVSEQNLLYYRLLQINSFVLWVSLVYSVLQSHLRIEIYAICLFVQIICSVLFWKHTKLVKQNNFSIVFSHDKPQALIRNGFYKYVRHPFYSIYFITYATLAIATFDITSIVLTLSIGVLYYKAAKQEEKKFEQSALADRYQEYKAEVGMFFPKMMN